MAETPMDHDLLARAADPLKAAARACGAEHLDAPTPCPDYDVRGLLNHLLFWGPSLEGAARKESTSPPAEGESGADLVGDDWSQRICAQVDRAVAAWSEPAAWEGMTTMTGAMELPAPTVGGMQLCEWVLHGWDLSRAIGVAPQWDDDVVDGVHAHVAGFIDMGRSMDAFGPAVEVADDAPALDRLLGLAGRDPAWAPGV